ncbi:hypothetical protein PLESTB_000575500 [Pleodorina starrii]|uniref:Uncharacterized protein n=1 Tax=Pleodorina starrii TaxID=330485 RepID=A0A9W6BH31_9CHLO|nr:hypothetical protein PLESTM_000309300 [Pleodorina starrii]GLC52037.1 hypothetical protein PLESTB_000575500 [Pleodorina starrii]GLC72178.1 hypothetical protein PLESTF_001215400 [Pleodorina starrii]
MPKAKPKGPTDADTSGDANLEVNAVKHQSDEAEDDLDMERRRLMARNRAKLIALGISVGVMELQDLARKRAQAHPTRPRPKPQSHKPPAEPTRRSARLAGGGDGDGGAAAATEPLMQLDEYGGAEAQGPGQAAAGEAPRRQPRSRAAGAGAEEDPEAGLSEEEIAARAELLRHREASRLRDLELEGLVDLSPDAAVFVVIGSTGNHYTVRLTDARRSCTCIDCIRPAPASTAFWPSCRSKTTPPSGTRRWSGASMRQRQRRPRRRATTTGRSARPAGRFRMTAPTRRYTSIPELTQMLAHPRAPRSREGGSSSSRRTRTRRRRRSRG